MKKRLSILLTIFLLIGIVGNYNFISNAASQKATIKTTKAKAMKEYRTHLWGEKFGVKNIMGDSIPEVLNSIFVDSGDFQEKQLWVYHYIPKAMSKKAEQDFGEKFISRHIIPFEANKAIYVNKTKKVVIEYDRYSGEDEYRVLNYNGDYKYDYIKKGNSCEKMKWVSPYKTIKISKSTFNKEVNSYLKGAKKYTLKDAKYKNNATNRKKYLS